MVAKVVGVPVAAEVALVHPVKLAVLQVAEHPAYLLECAVVLAIVPAGADKANPANDDAPRLALDAVIVVGAIGHAVKVAVLILARDGVHLLTRRPEVPANRDPGILAFHLETDAGECRGKFRSKVHGRARVLG